MNSSWNIIGLLILGIVPTIFGHNSLYYMIKYISSNSKDIIFVLWGGNAKSKERFIDLDKHIVLKSNHPSPLSANRGGWFGCKHFSKANDYLIKHGKTPINWDISQ